MANPLQSLFYILSYGYAWHSQLMSELVCLKSHNWDLRFSILTWMFSHSVVSNSCAPKDCSPLGVSTHGISQARILEWAAISFFQGIYPTQGSNPGLYVAGGFFTIWGTREAHNKYSSKSIWIFWSIFNLLLFTQWSTVIRMCMILKNIILRKVLICIFWFVSYLDNPLIGSRGWRKHRY